MKTSPSLYFKQTGSSLQISLASSPFNTGRRAPTTYQDEPFTVLHTDGLLPKKQISLTSPSLYFKQMGSFTQFSLTSSPFNTGRRAPTIHEDEPFTVLQTDGLLPTNLIGELSLQHRQTSSYYLSGRALHCTSHRRAPPQKTNLIDEPFSILQTDGLLHSVLIDELSLQHRQTSSYYS